MEIKREYNYSDIDLVPSKKCIVESRSRCDTGIKIKNKRFDLPIFPSNMPSVVNEKTCEYLAKRDLFYVMHRFGTNQIDFMNKMNEKGLFSSISVGVNEESFAQLKEIKSLKLFPFAITVDIAYAWSIKAERMTKFIKDLFPESFLIVGNVATGDAVVELEKWGADCTKVLIGPGLACTTKVFTGFTRPSVSCLLECSSAATKPIIADGGIREVGDIAKALACGASMIMIGSLFCGYDESGNEIIEIDGKKKCIYYGNASIEAKNGKDHRVEGQKVLLDYKGNMDKFLIKVKESLQSSISYAGGFDLLAMRNQKIVAKN